MPGSAPLLNISFPLAPPTRELNEVLSGQQFYGSVRLYYKWSNPPRKGRFHCDLPSANNPSVNQTLYADVGELY